MPSSARPSPASSTAPPAGTPVSPGTAAPGTAPTWTAAQRAVAWGVHAFTMSGLVWALLAMGALMIGRIPEMWLWLAVALIVDGIDGSLARAARVREVIPWFDGAVLDHVIDYLTWTFIPAVFIARWVDLGGGPWPMAVTIVICVSSVFCYCNTRMKSADCYFVGFPAAWNIVAVAMWILQLPAWANLLASAVLAVLTLVPWTYLHPFRVRRLMALNIAAVTVWIAATAALVVIHPHAPAGVMAAWWISGLWFLAVSGLRTIRGS